MAQILSTDPRIESVVDELRLDGQTVACQLWLPSPQLRESPGLESRAEAS